MKVLKSLFNNYPENEYKNIQYILLTFNADIPGKNVKTKYEDLEKI